MKRAYKLTPVSVYDVRGLEQWLEKMAAQGLFLKKYRPLVCTFTKGEPQQVRYRLEPFRYAMAIDLPDEDIVELFQECGWEFINGVHNEMLIFSSADPRAPEPHTDPDIQLEQWNKLCEKAKQDLRGWVVTDLLLLLSLALVCLWGGTFFANLVLMNLLAFNILSYLIINFLPRTLVNLSRVRELTVVIRELEGKPAGRRPWFPSRQFFSWAGQVCTILLLGSFVLLFNAAKEEPVLTEFTPPVILDTESGVTVGEDCSADYGFSPICWHQRRVWDFKTTGRPYYIYLEIYWFDFPDWLSFLAVPTARDLITKSMKLDSRYYPWRDKEPAVWTTREHSGSGADWLSTADSENGVYHTAAAALGDKVVLVQYVGHGDLADYLDEIVDMIK